MNKIKETYLKMIKEGWTKKAAINFLRQGKIFKENLKCLEDFKK